VWKCSSTIPVTSLPVLPGQWDSPPALHLHPQPVEFQPRFLHTQLPDYAEFGEPTSSPEQDHLPVVTLPWLGASDFHKSLS
jgi:hypothetical protein